MAEPGGVAAGVAGARADGPDTDGDGEAADWQPTTTVAINASATSERFI
jgi:hypothetical protein